PRQELTNNMARTRQRHSATPAPLPESLRYRHPTVTQPPPTAYTASPLTCLAPAVWGIDVALVGGGSVRSGLAREQFGRIGLPCSRASSRRRHAPVVAPVIVPVILCLFPRHQ
ncbi:MAG: hypothetical protein K0U66_08935, partial [Gammaproteobacteria bacterium]|nr:hypothetical protein [Gammaproteobacteria bacterium]